MITYNIHVPIGSASHDNKRTIKCHDSGVNFRIFPEIETKISQYRSTATPYIIPSGSIAILKVKKSDKTYVLTEGKVEHKSIYFEPHPQSFTASGKASAEVNIYDKNMRRITTATFYLDISKECACDCEQDSGSYVDILGDQIQSAIDAAERAEAAAKSAEYGAGRTAYDIAVKNGFEGTEKEWLESLNGTDGYTPQRGIDYWTPEDVSSMENHIDALFNNEVVKALEGDY